MKWLALLGLGVTIMTTAWAHQPATVADALTVERLRLDPPHADSAMLITQAANRYAGYHPLAQNRAEVRRLYAAFKRYCNGVLEKSRRKLDAARDRARPERPGRRANAPLSLPELWPC